MEERVNAKFQSDVKVQKSQTCQMPVCAVEIKEFPQAKVAMDIRIQDESSSVDLFFQNCWHPI